MKKIILLLCIFFLQNQITAQTGADITGLVKINNIQQSNTNRILLTDGNGNLGYTTFSSLSNIGTVVTTTLNTAVLKTQINQNAKFRNLPDASYNRVVTLDTNGSLGYRTFASLANSTTNLSGTLGLNATNLINLTTNIFSSPTSYTYVVVSDANGTLGKRPLSDFTTVQDPGKPCTSYTYSAGDWGAWQGCYRYRTITATRECYYINGTPYPDSYSYTDTDGTGCNPTGVCGAWATTSYGSWGCVENDVTQKVRNVYQTRTCYLNNGTSYTENQTILGYTENQAPVANFAWWPSYRTITLDVTSFSSDPDGTISKITVNWGDGVVDEYINSPSLGLLQHTYDNPDPSAPVVKPVSVTVTDDCGRVSVPNTQQITTASIVKNFSYTAYHNTIGHDWSGTTSGDSNYIGNMSVNQVGNDIAIIGTYALFEPGTEGAESGYHEVYFIDNNTSTLIGKFGSTIAKSPGGAGYCNQGDIVMTHLTLPPNYFNLAITNYFGWGYPGGSINEAASYIANLQFYGAGPLVGGVPFLDECIVPQGFAYDLEAPQILNGEVYMYTFQTKKITFSAYQY